MNRVRFIQSGHQDAALNMATDEALLCSFIPGKSRAILRLYGWTPPALSIGVNQDPEKILNLKALENDGVDFVRRPTGGGILLHDEEITYSIVTNTSNLDLNDSVKNSYEKITSFLLLAYRAFITQVDFAKNLGPIEKANPSISEICFSRNEGYDILALGKKLGGSAQKRSGSLILQHGSIPLAFNSQKLSRYVHPAIQGSTFENITSINEIAGENITFEEMTNVLSQAFCLHFNIELVESELTNQEKNLTQQLEKTKYAAKEWNYRRTIQVKS